MLFVTGLSCLGDITIKGEPVAKGEKDLVSPLRYPGSKKRLAAYILKLLEQNELFPDILVEPFAGSASVSLQALQSGYVKKIGLIEKDPLVASFWKAVFYDTDWLIEQVEKIPVTIEQWKKFKFEELSTPREQAIACIFLNRTSFSGILAPSVGPIGGWEQKSKYKIDCRFSKETIIKRIQAVAKLSKGVAFVSNSCWSKGLKDFYSLKKYSKYVNNCFIYFDPPFFKKADRLYRYYFKQEDHENLKKYVEKLESPWILSYDSGLKVQDLYKDMLKNSKEVDFVYSSAVQGKRKVSQEVLLSNLDLSLKKEVPLTHLLNKKRCRAIFNQTRRVIVKRNSERATLC